MSQLNFSHIAHLDRSSIHRLYRDVTHIFQTLYHTDSSDVVLIGVLLDIATASIGVVALQGIKHLAYGNTAGIQLVGIDSHLILLDVAAPTAHLGNAWSSGKLLAHNPVLHGSELGERVFMLVSLLGTNGIVVDFAQSCGDRSHLCLGVLRQFFLQLLHHLTHLRTCPIDISGIIEDKRDDRESASGDTSALLNSRNIGECHLYRCRNILFHLLCSQRRSLRDDLYLIICNIWSRIERQMHKRPDTPYRQGYREYSNHQFVANGISNKFLKHKL